MIHIQVVASDENGVRVFAYGVLERNHQLVVAQASSGSGVHMPYRTVRQTVVATVLRQVHPIGFSNMDGDRHMQFRTLLQYGVHTRVVQMDTSSLCGARIQVAFALVAHLTDTHSAQRMAMLQIGNSLVSGTILQHLRVVEAAPEAEAVGIAAVACDDFLEGSTYPRAVHHMRLAYVASIHILHPCLHLLRRLDIVVGVHINYRVLRLLHIANRDVIHIHGSKIPQQKGIHHTDFLLGLCVARSACHKADTRQKTKENISCFHNVCC